MTAFRTALTMTATLLMPAGFSQTLQFEVASVKLGPSGAALDAAALMMSRSRDIDRPIVNRTGLDGTFDLDLHFRDQQTSAAGPPSADGASIFTAVQEQLGLKLESQRMPMDVVVIDSVERPSPD
jgi:uncharacterized protein (TIGR03435 family)